MGNDEKGRRRKKQQQKRRRDPIWKWAKRSLLLLLVVILAVAGIVLVRTLTFRSQQPRVKPVPPVPLDQAAVLGRLARAIQLRTISHHNKSEMDYAPFGGSG